MVSSSQMYLSFEVGEVGSEGDEVGAGGRLAVLEKQLYAVARFSARRRHGGDEGVEGSGAVDAETASQPGAGRPAQDRRGIEIAPAPGEGST